MGILHRDDVIRDIASTHGARICMIGPYLGNKTKTSFACDAGHEWSALPQNVRKGMGCRVCSLGRKGLRSRLLESDVRDRIKEKHSGRVRLVSEYKGTKRLGAFVCDQGHEWSALVNWVLMGHGCNECSLGRVNKLKCKPAADARRQVKEAHGDRIKIIGGYTAASRKAHFLCECGHSWRAVVSRIIRGGGCPVCQQKFGFNELGEATLYYFAVKSPDGQTLYKIGVTNRSPEERFAKFVDRYRLRLVAQWHFSTGAEALSVERMIIRRFNDYAYRGQAFLLGGGNTEMFVEDVLMLDAANFSSALSA